MKNLSLEIKSFFKSKPRLITFIAFFIAVFCHYSTDTLRPFLKLIGDPDVSSAGFYIFFWAQKYGYYFFVFFILISYWLFSLVSKSNLEEALRVTKKTVRNVYLHQFVFLMIINLLVTLTFTVINLVSAHLFGMLTGKYAIHIILTLVLNFLLTDLLAIIIGFVLSGIKNRPVAYLSVVVVALFSSDLLLDVVSTLYEGFKLNIYPVSRLFTLFTPSLGSTAVFSFGVSILPYRWEAVLLWIFFFSAFAVYRVSTRKNIRIKSITAGFIALSVVCATLGLMPQSKVIKDYSPDQANFGDVFFYRDIYDGTEKTVPADFEILKYDMKFKVRNVLHAEVTVTVDDDSLKEYRFTLNHGFKVKKVLDENGNPLKFEQNVDYLNVYPQSKTQKITFVYSGYHHRYYANMQGVCLPAFSIYYPVAGSIVLYRMPYKGNVYHVPKTVSEFNVDVDYYQNVLSNFKSDERNHFSGKSNGFTMVSGFFDEKETNGTRIIYAPLDLANNPINTKRWFEEYKNDMDLIQGKTFIDLPNVNQLDYGNQVYIDHYTSGPYAMYDEIKEAEENKK